jgi:hypothetical protein
MSSESLQEILGTYSVIEALKKFARLDRPEDDLDSFCVCFSNMKAASATKTELTTVSMNGREAVHTRLESESVGRL